MREWVMRERSADRGASIGEPREQE